MRPPGPDRNSETTDAAEARPDNAILVTMATTVGRYVMSKRSMTPDHGGERGAPFSSRPASGMGCVPSAGLAVLLPSDVRYAVRPVCPARCPVRDASRLSRPAPGTWCVPSVLDVGTGPPVRGKMGP
ncbi:hypothetical protein GCM10010234_23310 [Streptomyces hawaiiensis]